MISIQYLLLAFSPGLLWLWFFRSKDDLEPEPPRNCLICFALGCGSVFLVLWIRPYFEALLPMGSGRTYVFMDSFLVTAGLEESSKLLVFFFGSYLLHEFDEPLDGIVYGAAVALGFASVENVYYLLGTGDPSVVVMRAFTATLGHVAFTGSLGFFFGVAKFSRPSYRPWLMLAGWTSAVLLHGAYDFFLFGQGNWRFLSLLLLLPLMLVLLGLKIRILRARSPRFHSPE